MSKAWIFQRAEQVREVGADKAAWYVGWIDPQDSRHSRSCGVGDVGKDRAGKLKDELENDLSFHAYTDISGPAQHRVRGMSDDELKAFDGKDVVYFIEAVGLERVKIGTSVCLPFRVHTLRTESPVRLKVLFVIEGDGRTEAGLHARFAAFRLHGEWFQATGRLRKAMASLKDAAQRARSRPSAVPQPDSDFSPEAN